MSRFRMSVIMVSLVLVAAGSLPAAAEHPLGSFVFVHPALDQVAAPSQDWDSALAGMSESEMLGVLYDLAARTTCEWSDPPRSEPGFGFGPFPGLDLGTSEKAVRRPALPPGLAAEALEVLDQGTCVRCFFGENAESGRRGFDVRWMVPIPGFPNAYHYKGYENFPTEAGDVIEIPPDPDLLVKLTQEVVLQVLPNPGVVIDSYFDSGGAVVFYYAFTYDLGDGPRAFFMWDVQVMEVQ